MNPGVTTSLEDVGKKLRPACRRVEGECLRQRGEVNEIKVK